MTKAVSAHVMEGMSRFEKPAPGGALFESGADIAALAELHHKLEFFPTPPWAVRAMVYALALKPGRTLEPACGQLHIVSPLREMGFDVHAMDIHDHGVGAAIGDFLQSNLADDVYELVISNPPFKLAQEFIRLGQTLAPRVVMLCRMSFISTVGRHDLHFNNPAGNLRYFMPCLERVPMVLGRYDPQASTATEFAWYVYDRGYEGPAEVKPIAPGAKAKFQRREDVWI